MGLILWLVRELRCYSPSAFVRLNRLVGLSPLFRSRQSVFSMVKVRRIKLISSFGLKEQRVWCWGSSKEFGLSGQNLEVFPGGLQLLSFRFIDCLRKAKLSQKIT